MFYLYSYMLLFIGVEIARYQKFTYILHYIRSNVVQHFYILLHC